MDDYTKDPAEKRAHAALKIANDASRIGLRRHLAAFLIQPASGQRAYEKCRDADTTQQQ